MDYKEYQVKVYNNRKQWYLNGIDLTEEEFNIKMKEKNNDCAGKVVEIDGKKYRLQMI